MLPGEAKHPVASRPRGPRREQATWSVHPSRRGRSHGRGTVQRGLYCLGVAAAVGYGEVLARFGHALSDPTRARVLLALREAAGYPAELAELLGVSRQSLSNHLACLRGCGLVVATPEGRRTRYELADGRLGHALGDLLGLVLPSGDCAVDAERACR